MKANLFLLMKLRFPTARFEEIKNNKGYHNQIGMLQLIFQKRKKTNS